MKKIKINISMLAVIAIMTALSFTSCTKDHDDLLPEPVVEQDKPEFVEVVVGFYFTWDEWGRAKKDCDGGGLCNFRLEEIVIEVGYHYVVVQTDNEGNNWVDIPIQETMPPEYNYDFFPIDEDLHYTMDDGDTYTVPAGMYPRNEEIGMQGGYRLPLILE